MTTANVLSEPLFRLLHSGSPVVLVTVGADGWGHAALTWAVAVAPDRVRFAVDHPSTTLANLEREGKATLQVIGPGNALALLKGAARVLRPRVHAAPFEMAMWEMALAEVKDQSWAPVVVSPLAFAWTGPDADNLRRIEQAVLTEMRTAPPS
jgi:flavin reductase (DIM6/NTAB) family NADH-FMN oxidoreductase RutF